MEIVDRVLKKYAVPNITADRKKFLEIFEDMRRSGGSFIPTPTWLLCKHPDEIESEDLSQIIDAAGSEEVFQKEFSNLEQRFAGWVGVTRTLDEECASSLVANYAAFLKEVDPLGLWQANVEEKLSADRLRVADLGSIMDLNLLFAYSYEPTRKITRILEIGGGYGRLAEAAFNVFGKSIRYVLVDSVPVSLYYAKEYLKQACPDVRLGSYYDGDPFDLNEFDCYILPSWYFSALNKEKYDVCINIESFQEMNQQHIDSYLQLFNTVSVDDATIYVSNSHDYLFHGIWRYPKNWLRVFCANTPRSATSNHPTEIFRKKTGDSSLQNAMLDGIHNYLRWKYDAVLANQRSSVESQESRAETYTPTLGDQVELLMGKQVRTILRSGKDVLRPAFRKLVALRAAKKIAAEKLDK